MVRGLGVCFVALVVLWPALSAGRGPQAIPPEPGVALAAITPPPKPVLSPNRQIVAFSGTPPTAATGIPIPVASCDHRAGQGRTAMAAADTATRFVTVSYCLLLKRLPDSEGLAYWSDQMAAGLSPVEVVGQLLDSPEYRARGVRNFNSSLDALTLAAHREEERQLRAAETAAAQAVAEADARWRESLRVRTEITAAEFDRWVDARLLPDVDRVTPALVHARRYGGGQRVNIAYVHLSATRGVSVSPGGRRRATVGSWAQEIGAHAAINANWFAPFDGPAVSDGAVYGGRDHHYTALFGFTADGDAVVEHHRRVNDEIDDRVIDAVAGHPTLIDRGTATTDFGGDPTFTARHPRTVIGLDETGDVLILVTVDGRRATARGMTGDETVALMAELGAQDALMLDGGGSTTMWIAGKGVVNKPSGPLRAVGNQLAVFGD